MSIEDNFKTCLDTLMCEYILFIKYINIKRNILKVIWIKIRKYDFNL